jgi:hypothetical protein
MIYKQIKFIKNKIQKNRKLPDETKRNYDFIDLLFFLWEIWIVNHDLELAKLN